MQPPNLHFQWKAREGRGVMLLVFVVTVLLATTAFFLMFQVVYPATRKQPLTVQRILFLDSNLPVTRQLTDSVNDRDFVQIHSNAGDLTQLATQAPVFSPSFKGFELVPHDFIESQSHDDSALPRLFLPNHPPLPPVARPLGIPVASPVGKPQVLQATLSDGLEQRQPLRPVNLADASFADAAGTSYRIAVAPSGRVTMAMPLNETKLTPEASKALRARLDTLRFPPSTKTAGVQWGTLTLRWQESPGKP